MTPTTRALRDHLEEAAAARRRGDLAAADAAETAALLALRTIILPDANRRGGTRTTDAMPIIVALGMRLRRQGCFDGVGPDRMAS